MSDPQRLSSIIHRLAAGWGIENPMQTAKLFSNWDQIVGSQVADNCRPMTLKGGVLKVSASSAAWSAQLRYLAPALIRRINTEMGATLVTEVRARVSLDGQKPPPGRR